MEASGFLRTDLTMENRSESTLIGDITTEETDIGFSAGNVDGDDDEDRSTINPNRSKASQAMDAMFVVGVSLAFMTSFVWTFCF